LRESGLEFGFLPGSSAAFSDGNAHPSVHHARLAGLGVLDQHRPPWAGAPLGRVLTGSRAKIVALGECRQLVLKSRGDEVRDHGHHRAAIEAA